eukprot:1376535-Rhodomonas_salina.1
MGNCVSATGMTNPIARKGQNESPWHLPRQHSRGIRCCELPLVGQARFDVNFASRSILPQARHTPGRSGVGVSAHARTRGRQVCTWTPRWFHVSCTQKPSHRKRETELSVTCCATPSPPLPFPTPNQYLFLSCAVRLCARGYPQLTTAPDSSRSPHHKASPPADESTAAVLPDPCRFRACWLLRTVSPGPRPS